MQGAKEERNEKKVGATKRSAYDAFFERKARYWNERYNLAKDRRDVTEDDERLTEEERGGFRQPPLGRVPAPVQTQPPGTHINTCTNVNADTQPPLGGEAANDDAGDGVGDAPLPPTRPSSDAACREYLASFKTKPKTIPELMARNEAFSKLVTHHGYLALKDALLASREAGSKSSQKKINAQFRRTVQSWRNENTKSITLPSLMTSAVVPQYEKTFSCEERHSLAAEEEVCSTCNKKMEHEAFQTSLHELLHSLMLQRDFA